MIIKGIVIHNLGVAHTTIPKQKPFFKSEIPEIDTYRNGTINLLMDKSLKDVLTYDCYFTNLEWDDNKPDLREDFGFIKIIKLKHRGETFLNWGYIYFPLQSPNRTNTRLIELLGKNDPDIHTGDRLEILIENGYIR